MFLNYKLLTWPQSLSSRITLSYSLTFIGLIASVLAGLYLLVGQILDNRIDEDLIEDIAEFNMIYRDKGFDGLIEEFNRETFADNSQQVFIQLYRDTGELVYQSPMTHWQNLTKLDMTKNQFNEPVLETQYLPAHEFAIRIVYGAILPQYMIQLGETTESKMEIMLLLQYVFALVFLLVLPVAAIVVFIMTKKSLAGFKAVNLAAKELERGNFEYRISTNIKELEIKQLAITFNAMAQRINELIIEMREMTDNIAHDLRSPLGRIRAISEMMLTSKQNIKDHQLAAENTLHECDRLLLLINTTLDVAEAEAGIKACQHTSVNLTELIKDACELFEIVALDKKITLTSIIEKNCVISGHIQNLQRMVANLIDNAIKYTPTGGSVAISLEQNKQGIKLTVADTGIGIASNDQMRVFERFYRAEQSRSQEGCGLGLSFSRAVARAHGGDLVLKSKPLIKTEFTVLLPMMGNFV